MSAYKNLLLVKDDPKELQKWYVNLNFYNDYQNKTYNKLTNEIINVILKSQLVISESYFELFKEEKVLLEIFMFLLAYKDGEVNKPLLRNFGFKRSSVGYAVRDFLKYGIIDEAEYRKSFNLKLTVTELKKPGEKYWTIKGSTLIKFFLLYGLSSTLVLMDSKYCFKSTKYKPTRENKKKLALIQNNYFKHLKLSKSKIYKTFLALAKFLIIPLKKLIIVDKKRVANWINVKNKFNQLVFRKVVTFETQRYITDEIKNLFVNF
ncbi:MAGa4850 family ICE element protein [Mycoplasma feriruminatoris]|uniref:Uncharacterized protein n=1 Tax=Mycoplasma feriruminatoris TaxID=1179777 RepID=A0AAX3TH84_9MOLU|nr:integrative conjugal element protein [Mycoplasma feriruminatoris]WFQ93030.1 hypothetical protein MFERI14822_00823 [Mycoplasma feriruminatoris]